MVVAEIIDVSKENEQNCLADIVEHLTGKTFNLLTMTSDHKILKFCGRQLSGKVFAKDGQVSIRLKPGNTIAWDLNTEAVELKLEYNGDILLIRSFKTGRKKVMIITTGPI